MTLEPFAEIVGVGLLAGVVSLLVYTLARYREQVLYRPAFGLLVGAAAVYAGSLAADAAGFVPVVREAAQLLAALLYLGAVWQFAAGFVHVEPDEDPIEEGVEITLSAEGGGFEDGE